MSEFGVHFGVMVPDLKEQFKKQKVEAKDKSDVDIWQACANGIELLAIRGVIPDSVRQKARMKLLKIIAKGVRRI
jgi:hypothetical protein